MGSARARAMAVMRWEKAVVLRWGAPVMLRP